ncbi:MAG: glycosyl transferase, family 2 [Candidatus Solibacter sp.]|nr:glycosyl transferase, family 2 [Candidatus Solibacter sp.]
MAVSSAVAYWFFVGPSLLLALLSLRGERKRAAYVAERLATPAKRLPAATVIVPVKGEEEGLRENLAALGALDYPDYELIITAQCASDIPRGVLPERARIVLANGGDPRASEKIQNLIAAVRAVRKRSEVLAFADSDGRPTKGWLRALVAPLAEEGVGASTGYRWFIPDPPDFWSLMRGVWDAVAAGTLGAGNNRFAWGGAMAIRKELFVEAGVADRWCGELSDDYALSEAVHAAGLGIAYAPGALTPNVEHTSGLRFLGWIRRQMAITRIYAPRLWWPGLIAHVFYCGGMAASVIASIQGNRLAEWALIAQLSPGMLKGLNRATLAKAALPEYEGWFKRHSWVHAIWVPLATWVWLYALASSAIGDSILWRGRRYPLKRPKR